MTRNRIPLRQQGPRVSPTLVAAPTSPRLRASSCDYLLIVAWLTASAGIVVTVLTFFPNIADVLILRSILITDVIAFCFSIFPVWTYFTLAESSRNQGSISKKRLGLRVSSISGDRIGLIRAGIRNAVKLAPWQLAHIAVVRLALDVDAPIIIATTYWMSVFLVILTSVMALHDPLKRALHDQVAATRVVRIL